MLCLQYPSPHLSLTSRENAPDLPLRQVHVSLNYGDFLAHLDRSPSLQLVASPRPLETALSLSPRPPLPPRFEATSRAVVKRAARRRRRNKSESVVLVQVVLALRSD
jgi:hypothetical protein